MATRTLFEALPNLVHDIEGALIRIGRGALADQLREVELERWTYDDFANVGNLYLKPRRPSSAADPYATRARRGETLCPSDDLAVNLDLDAQGRLLSIELLDAGAIISELEKRFAE